MIHHNNKKIDVVYPISNESEWEDNELRYSLRSIEKNLINLGNVYIVGECPKFLKNIIHFPKKDDEGDPGRNIIAKLLLTCSTKELSENFIFASDDQLLLKKTDHIKAYHRGNLNKKSKEYWIDEPGFRWKKRLRNAYAKLKKQGFTTYMYDVHIFIPINKYSFIRIINQLDYKKTLYPVNTVYFNMIDIERTHVGTLRATIYKHYSKKEIKERIKNKMFLSYSEQGLNKNLKEVLAELFPKKSKFETTKFLSS